MIDRPLKAILQRSDTFDHLAKWAIELGEFDIEYQSRTTIKVQVPTDFIVECTISKEKSGINASELEIGVGDN